MAVYQPNARERRGQSSGPASSMMSMTGIYQRLMSLEISPGLPPSRSIRLPAICPVSQTPVREALSRLEREGLVRKAHLIGYSAGAPAAAVAQANSTTLHLPPAPRARSGAAGLAAT